MRLWKPFVALLHLFSSLAFGAGEAERVMVASAKVRAALAAQAALPDQPPNLVVKPRRMSLEIAGEHVATNDDQRQTYEVTLHTTTGCPPCERMKAALAADSRINVTQSLNTIPRGVPASSFPFITFRDDSGTLRYNLTARTAAEVVGSIERSRSGRTTRRLTPAELRGLAKTWRGPEVGISGMTPHQHLMDDRHGFTADQLVGLTDRELRTIHSAHHAGDIEPFQSPSTTGATPPGDVVGASGAAGVIHARDEITAALDWIRSHVGEGVPVSFAWDRTGQQSFALLKRGEDWSALAILGRSGRISLSAPGAVNLPVDHLGFGYRVDGDDIVIDAEAVTFNGLAARFNPSSEASMSESPSTPATFGPATILTVFSVLRGVYSLLNPQADLKLGGNVSAVATLTGDVLSVKFNQAPSIRLVALFTFQLGVERVDISAETVRVLFTGSRFIRERTFKVD